MCGIAGFLDPAAAGDGERLLRLATAMADTIVHRGPDEGQAWADPEAGLGLGFRRLAIIDLTTAGRQPMLSASGRSTIVFNGEIYNAEDLRAELGPRVARWRGHSDTEVLLEAAEAWGIEAALNRTFGMFALAYWDRARRRLTLVRDRLGKKPLYWAEPRPGALIFGSELRALRAHPAMPREIDRDTVAVYLRHAYIPSPRTIYRGVAQLPPGHMLELEGATATVRPYWTLAATVREAKGAPFSGSDEEAVAALERLLADAVRRRMVSDVPLGAFLSGGIDSSIVVALMQKAASRPVRTFSIGFRERAYDESDHARAVARHLATDHTELILTPKEAQDVIPRLPEIYDEPFADSSQIPTFLVSELARRHVTVALSGDGGDEMFAGYTRYDDALTFARRLAPIPKPLRSAAAAATLAIEPSTLSTLASPLGLAFAGDRAHKLAEALPETPDGFYRQLISHWREPERVVIGANEPGTVMTDASIEAIVPDFRERLQYRDTLMYLPDDILVKVDRASMAVSLEARAPLLDHRVAAFAWSLPMEMKVRGGVTKWVLRELLYRHVPRAIVDRPKTGFGVPVGEWIRGPLREWAEDLLSERRLREAGLLAVGEVRKRWQDHLSGVRNWTYVLWAVLILEAWRRRHAG
jgi:asparagine synthase (glutamine-hydrolysing)